MVRVKRYQGPTPRSKKQSRESKIQARRTRPVPRKNNTTGEFTANYRRHMADTPRSKSFAGKVAKIGTAVSIPTIPAFAEDSHDTLHSPYGGGITLIETTPPTNSPYDTGGVLQISNDSNADTGFTSEMDAAVKALIIQGAYENATKADSNVTNAEIEGGLEVYYKTGSDITVHETKMDDRYFIEAEQARIYYQGKLVYEGSLNSMVTVEGNSVYMTSAEFTPGVAITPSKSSFTNLTIGSDGYFRDSSGKKLKDYGSLNGNEKNSRAEPGSTHKVNRDDLASPTSSTEVSGGKVYFDDEKYVALEPSASPGDKNSGWTLYSL